MDSIIRRLKVKAQAAPTSTLLKDTISLLEDLQRNPDIAIDLSWDTLRWDFTQLQEHGLWEQSKENDDLLGALWDSLTAASNKASQATQPSFETSNAEGVSKGRFLMLHPPSQSFVVPQLIPSADPPILPLELMEVLDKTYFLHLLATDPGQVLPPGKSLLSAMSRPHVHSEGNSKPTLQNKVEKLAHKAFWDEVRTSLFREFPEAEPQIPAGHGESIKPRTSYPTCASEATVCRHASGSLPSPSTQTSCPGNAVAPVSSHILTFRVCHFASSRSTCKYAGALCTCSRCRDRIRATSSRQSAYSHNPPSSSCHTGSSHH